MTLIDISVRTNEPAENYAKRMIEIVEIIRNRVVVHAGDKGHDIDDVISEMQEIEAGAGEAVAWRNFNFAIAEIAAYGRLRRRAKAEIEALIEREGGEAWHG